jgi:RNA polymerase I specific transcription initiation factor RRN3
VNQFSQKPSNPESLQNQQPGQIRFWILALSHVVSRLERRHSALVEAIVNMPWTTLDSATVKSYTVFIGMLLSAKPEYLSLVLSKTVQGFTHRTPPSFNPWTQRLTALHRIWNPGTRSQHARGLFKTPDKTYHLRPTTLPPQPHPLLNPNSTLNTAAHPRSLLPT